MPAPILALKFVTGTVLNGKKNKKDYSSLFLISASLAKSMSK